jgi:hypothetical protein
MLSAARTYLNFLFLDLRVPDLGDTLLTNSPPRGYPSMGVAVKHRQLVVVVGYLRYFFFFILLFSIFYFLEINL